MSRIIAVTLLISAIAIGASSCTPDHPEKDYIYKFTPENNPNWTCFRWSKAITIYCVEDAPGYAK